MLYTFFCHTINMIKIIKLNLSDVVMKYYICYFKTIIESRKYFELTIIISHNTAQYLTTCIGILYNFKHIIGLNITINYKKRKRIIKENFL